MLSEISDIKVKDAKQDGRLTNLEQRVERLENLSLTLAENQQQAQESLIKLSTSVEQTNELLKGGMSMAKKGLPMLAAVFLAALGVGSQAGVM